MQPMDYSPPFSSPRDSLGSAIMMMTDSEDELFAFELTLRSCRLDENNNPVRISKEVPPLVNDFGATQLVGMVQSLVNRIIYMGKIEKMEIHNVMDFANDNITLILMVNKRSYGIKNDGDRYNIQFMALCYCFAALKRGYEEGERRFWKGSVMEMRQSMESPQKREGFISKFWK